MRGGRERRTKEADLAGDCVREVPARYGREGALWLRDFSTWRPHAQRGAVWHCMCMFEDAPPERGEDLPDGLRFLQERRAHPAAHREGERAPHVDVNCGNLGGGDGGGGERQVRGGGAYLQDGPLALRGERAEEELEAGGARVSRLTAGVSSSHCSNGAAKGAHHALVVDEVDCAEVAVVDARAVHQPAGGAGALPSLRKLTELVAAVDFCRARGRWQGASADADSEFEQLEMSRARSPGATATDAK